MVDQYCEFSVNFANEADDYDSPWKDAVEHYFSAFMAFMAFMAFYFPDEFLEIDWSNGYTILDQELMVVVRDA